MVLQQAGTMVHDGRAPHGGRRPRHCQVGRPEENVHARPPRIARKCRHHGQVVHQKAKGRYQVQRPQESHLEAPGIARGSLRLGHGDETGRPETIGTRRANA